MGTYGNPITQPIPAVGLTGPTYAQEVDDFLTEVKTRLESKVPLASLQAGTLDMSNNPVNNVEWLGLYDQSIVPASPIGSLQSYLHDLWWVSAAGAVQLTNGAAINGANIGGITGDYGGVNPAQFRYVAADQEYYAYSDYAGGNWAKVWAQNFDIAAANTGAVRVRLSAAGVGSSYTITLPASLPAATNTYPLLLNNTGQLSAPGYAIANDYKVTAAGNTGSGFAQYLNLTPAGTLISVNATVRSITSTAINWQYDGPTLPNRVGDRITGLGFQASTKTGNITLVLAKYNIATGVTTTMDTFTFTPTGAAHYAHVVTTPIAIALDECWFLSMTGTAAGEAITGMFVYYDHP